MTMRPPQDILSRLPTPCLVVDVAACDRNLARAAAHFAASRAKLRPHFKAHKCTTLLRRQLAAGACCGVTCATAAEAEVLADHGFDDILLANQVVDRPGLRALGAAARNSSVTVAVDHLQQVEWLGETAAGHDAELGILIEIDVGMGRSGIAPGSGQLLELAGAIARQPGLVLRGLQGYEGHAVLLPDRADRLAEVRRAAGILSAGRRQLTEHGYPCPIISGGGTGTYDLATAQDVLNEIQAGSYALLDVAYARLGLPFENALSVVASVISRQRPDTAVLNAGLKALTVEYGLPEPVDANLCVARLADEHAFVSVGPEAELSVGDAVVMIPAHVDPAINLHDALFAWDERRGTLEAWPVDGRRHEAEALLAAGDST